MTINGKGQELVLAGDVGGTKTTLALFARSPTALHMLTQQTYATQLAGSLMEIIERFLAEKDHPTVGSACFGVAGPVFDGVADIVNLPWLVETELLLNHFTWPRLKVVNDLVALAAAIPHLQSGQLLALHRGVPGARANIGLLAAGTGLGEALLVWDGVDYIPSPSEGGHKDFAPRTEQEFRLLQFLADRYGHVSVERILSGQGLSDLYQFSRSESSEKEPEWLARELADTDPAAVITRHGLAGTDSTCRKALHMFVRIFGAEAGNIALQGLTYGGMYIGGGIGPKIKDALTSGLFMRTFLDKGRMRALLSKMPVHLITDPHASVWGAAVYATKERSLTSD